MNVYETLAIDELHEFLKSKLMHQSDPRRRLIDDAFGVILNRTSEEVEYLGRYASERTRRWPYFAAIAIYNHVWCIDMQFSVNDYRFVKCLQKYLQDFPRLAYLNASLDDPKLQSFRSLIGKLVRVPEYRDFWASFDPVEQKAPPALDKEEIRNAINVEVNAWRSSFESHLKFELRERIKQELKQELREDIRNELKAELKVSIEEELKAEFKGDVEASQDEEPGPTRTHEMEQSTTEEDSSSSIEDSTNGQSTDDAGNESKGVATEPVEELVGNLINTLKPKIDVKIRKSEKDELKDAFQGDVEARPDEETGPTVTYEMEQSTSGVFSEEDSNSSREDLANGQSTDEPRNESKGVATEAIEELPEDLVIVEKPKINVKNTQTESEEHKDELAEESTNDQINQAAKQEMHLEIQKELDGELRVSIDEESKAEIREPIETKVDEVKLTVPREMEQRDESREEVSNSLQKESAYGFSMDDVRNETKRIVTEAIEELKGDLVSILESKIKGKIAKSVKNELKDELTEEVANDLMDFKRDMKKKQTKMMDTLREQLHEDIKDEIVQMIQQDLKKCLQDLRRNKPN